MRKTILIFLICFATFSQAFSQATNIDSINWQLRDLFGNLAKPSNPKLFNWDMAFHTVDSSLFVDINTDDTLSTFEWLKMYEEMRDCAYDTTAWLHEDDVIAPSYLYGPDTVNILAMKFDYYRFKPNALNTNIYFDFDTVNNIITDKAVRPGFPYDDFSMFAAASSKNISSAAEVVYRIGTDNIFYDNFNVLDGTSASNNTYMHINFHDGSGWHSVNLGQDDYITINYPAPGKYAIETIIGEQLGGSIFNRSISYMMVNDSPSSPFDVPDSRYIKNGMTVGVYEPCDTNLAPENIKTLIYVEGYDMMDILALFNFSRNLGNIYRGQIRNSGLSDLRNFGYRILVVNWWNSRQDIHNNADNLVAFLEDLKCGAVVGDLNPDEQFVIMAESMGGLVAILALLKMEVAGYQGNCYPDKKHNTRLLLTMDTPHWGAHVPMSIQKMARYVQNRIIPIPLVGRAITQFYFKAFDLFLDGDAAKQMLREHVSTQSILGPHLYQAHRKFYDLRSDIAGLGSTPEFCKTVAVSNGNMNGEGQTRLWDGQPRVAGDRLLEVESNLYGTILGRRFQYFGGHVRLNTDPNGAGQLGTLSAGTWWFKIRLKWFGLRIKTGFNSLAYKDWQGDMLPVSTSSGGIYDFNSRLLPTLGIASMNYQPNSGNWTRNTPNKWGRTGLVGTEGLHWCFVPSASGLNFSNALNAQIENSAMGNVGAITSAAAYDVIMGPELDQLGNSTTIPTLLNRNITLRNRDHLEVRNDTLRDNALAWPHFIEYDHSCAQQPIRLLHREIGDDELFLENRNLPWNGKFSIHKKIWINEHCEFYEYDGVPINPDKIRPRIYSKTDPFEITGSNGYAQFFTNAANVQYNPPHTGPYSIEAIVPEGNPCCTNFRFKTTNENQQHYVNKKVEDGIFVFPNPTTGQIVIKFLPKEKGLIKYVLYDMQGRALLNESKEIIQAGREYYLPINLPNGLSKGQYLLKTQLDNKTFTNKLIME